MRLGEWLVTESMATHEAVRSALAIQRRSGGMLGDILLAARIINPLQWKHALHAQGIPTLDSDLLWEADTALLHAGDIPVYTGKQYIPLRFGTQIWIATPAPDAALKQWADAYYAADCVLKLITARELHACLLRHFNNALDHEARELLHRLHPHVSARQPVLAGQRNGFLALLALLLASAVLAPVGTWHAAITISTLFYLATLAFKLVLLINAPVRTRRHASWHKTAQQLSDRQLPVYSILVPLYRESPHIAQQILRAIDALDYPKTKLDVWLITESDDPATREHLQALAPPDYCRMLTVPASLPRTKPKACNVALPLLRGEFVTIYDAEDKPAPDQLRLSVAAFSHSRRQVACLQAPLNYYNRGENLITQLFSIEYSALFRLFLPALRRLRIPIPLGGTSNHIRLDALRAVHGWDPYNVTEDADLGIRLAYHGYTTDILPSLTLEESPVRIGPWLRQRSRWIKGYIQTWLVYMRSPLDLLKQLGAPAFFGFQLFVGAPAITFLLAPLFWGLFFVSLSGVAPAMRLPDWLLLSCSVTLVLGFALQWATAILAVRREQWNGLLRAQALYPAYWVLHSLACVKALWQLIVKPHYWEKTSHGQSRIFKNSASNG